MNKQRYIICKTFPIELNFENIENRYIDNIYSQPFTNLTFFEAMLKTEEIINKLSNLKIFQYTLIEVEGDEMVAGIKNIMLHLHKEYSSIFKIYAEPSVYDQLHKDSYYIAEQLKRFESILNEGIDNIIVFKEEELNEN